MRNRIFLFQLTAVSLIFLLITNTYAWQWTDLWLTPNQQASQKLKKGEPKQAAELFQNPQWRGISYYRAGDYEKALSHFKQDDSAYGYYNQGNALAYLGRYEEAIAAYDQSLAKNPNFEDAQHNRSLVQQLLDQKESNPTQTENNSQTSENRQQQNSEQNSQAQNNSSSRKEDSANSNQEHNSSEKNENTSSSDSKTASEIKNSNSSKQTESSKSLSSDQTEKQAHSELSNKNSESENIKKEYTENSLNPSSKESGENHSKQKSIEQESVSQETRENEIFFSQIPDDPGGLLKRKFLRDHARQ